MCMKKSFVNCIALIFITVVFSSCNWRNSYEETFQSEDTSTITTAIVTSESEVTTQESIQIPEYSVGKLDVNYTFDELLDFFIEKNEVDINELDEALSDSFMYSNSHGDFVYVQDYAPVLEFATSPRTGRINEESGTNNTYYEYVASDLDYHVTRYLYADFMYISEFDDDYWAEEYFRGLVEATMNRNTLLSSSSTDNGYLFVLDDSIPYFVKFSAYYYIGNYIIDYSYILDNGDINDYSNYLVCCDELGLPTCDQITEMILD